MNKKVLLIEDDLQMQKFIIEYLEDYNFECFAFAHPKDTLENFKNNNDYSIIILDLMLPDMDGFDLFKKLKQIQDIPIIISSARGDIGNKIHGFELGADDYLAKPFEFPELLARIRALSRRINKTFYNDIIEYNNLKLNCCNAILTYKQIEVSLSPRENQLMELLIRNTHQILPREQIIDKIWGYDTNINSNTLDVTIKSLRQKLTKLSLSDCIHTIRGIGYKFEMDI